MKVELDDVLVVVESFREREYSKPFPKASVDARILDELISKIKEVRHIRYYDCINCGKPIYFDEVSKVYRHESGNPVCASNATIAIPYPPNVRGRIKHGN